MIRHIRIGTEVMDPSRKRKFNGGGYRGSHRGHWERSGANGNRNLEGQNHRNGVEFGGGRGGHSGGRQDENNSGGGGARGGNGNSTNSHHQDRHRMRDSSQKYWDGGMSA